MPETETFELLGISGLRLPGTVESPCPKWPSVDEVETPYQLGFFHGLERRGYFEDIAMRAATAACWWLRECGSATGDQETFACFQHDSWQGVFEQACERRWKEK